MHIAITGASGQLGTAVLKKFKDTKHNITLLLNKPLYSSDAYNIIHFDLTNPNLSNDKNFFQILQTIDVVINLAGYINIHPENEDQINLLYTINGFGTINFFKLCEKAKIKKIIYISSIEALLPDDTREFCIDGYFSRKHLTDYGHSKAMATKYILTETLCDNISVIFPSGIISYVKYEPPPLMKFIYSIPDTKIQIYPPVEFYFIDGDLIALKIWNILEEYNKGIIHNKDISLMFGNKVYLSDLLIITKKISGNNIFPILFPIPKIFLKIIAYIGEYIQSPTINLVVFDILFAKNNLLGDALGKTKSLYETIQNSFSVNK